MARQTKVSVILISFNHAGYIRQAIESVLNQTFTNFELIIWDDASTDESWQIIQSYSDARIRAFRNETNRVNGNINQAISEVAVGEYIAVHHSDDVWEPQKLEEQVAFLAEDPGVGAVFSRAMVVGETGEPLADESHPYHHIFDQPNRSRHEWLNHFFYRGNALCHPSVLIRKACYDNCGLYKDTLMQLDDFDMWVRVCLKYEIHVLPEKLVRFRVREHEEAVSGNTLESHVRGQFELLEIYENFKGLRSSEEFVRVFPTAKKYFGQAGFDLGFALGMTALGAGTPNSAKLFGLELLFAALNDPERARKIKGLYGFGHKQFMSLTAEHDVFSVRFQAQLEADVQALSARLAKIESSRAWKIVLLSRRIRDVFAPPNSRRARALR